MLNIKNLETFIVTAELGSFTRAADRLGYSQSTVSFQIKQLEEELGTPLFERINHSIKLTPKGSEILRLAHRMKQAEADIRRAAEGKQEIRGHIRMAIADSLCHWLLWDNYKEFHSRYPGISLTIISASTEEMIRMLKQNEVDLVYTLDKHFYDSNYVIVSEMPVRAHFVAPAGHELCRRGSVAEPAGAANGRAGEDESAPVHSARCDARPGSDENGARIDAGAAVTINKLVNYPFILTEKGMSYRRIMDEELARNSLEIIPFLETGDTSLICRLVEQNMGLSFLPDYVTERSVKEGLVSHIDVSDFAIDTWVQLFYHRDKWCTPEMQCLIDYLDAAVSRLGERCDSN